MGARPAASILALERAENLGRRASVRYSRSLVGRNSGERPADLEDQPGILEPGDRDAAADVKDSIQALVHQVRRARGQPRGVGRGGEVVLDHANGLAGGGQPQHQFDEIPARRVQRARPEDSRSADDQRFVQISLGEQLSGQLGNRIGAQRVRRVELRVSPAGGAVEDVVGREVDEMGIHLPAGDGDVPDRQRIDRECGVRFALRHIHLVIGRGVHYNRWVQRADGFFHLKPVRDIDNVAVPPRDVITPGGELGGQLLAQLAGVTQDSNLLPHLTGRIPRPRRPVTWWFVRERRR